MITLQSLSFAFSIISFLYALSDWTSISTYFAPASMAAIKNFFLVLASTALSFLTVEFAGMKVAMSVKGFEKILSISSIDTFIPSILTSAKSRPCNASRQCSTVGSATLTQIKEYLLEFLYLYLLYPGLSNTIEEYKMDVFSLPFLVFTDRIYYRLLDHLQVLWEVENSSRVSQSSSRLFP